MPAWRAPAHSGKRPVSSPGTFLFAAVHKGPYLSIQPLEQGFGSHRVSYLLDGVSKEERLQQRLPFLDMDQVTDSWQTLEMYMQTTATSAVIRSSSENVGECNVEQLASEAARNLGIPVFVVEDFPGNYVAQPGERLDGLFVEDESLAEIHESRGIDSQVVHVTGNPRYNELKQVDRKARRTESRSALALGPEKAVLWAGGGPDGGNSFRALERLINRFPGEETILLFRAHPRDPDYIGGRYGTLLAQASIKVLDVSEYPDILGLYCAADLVITQFSSAGVEASYLGVPALFVLFDDLGKKYLRTFKGYEVPPWCRGGCAFLIERVDDVDNILRIALFDQSARDQVRANFQQRFGARTNSVQVITRLIQKSLGAEAV